MRKELFHLYIFYSFQWGVSVAGLMLAATIAQKAWSYAYTWLQKHINKSGRPAARDYEY